MIYDILTNAEIYTSLHADFAKAFDFLRRSELKNLAAGRYAIDGDQVFAIVAKDQGRDRDQGRLEVHERYIDIQMVLAGVDEMGWLPKSQCQKPVELYNPEEDIGFYADFPAAWLPVTPGLFVIFFPDDAHLPLVSLGLIHKVVVKVAVE